MTRRDDREYREYLREEQRSQRGCIAGRMQLDFHHGLLGSTVSTPSVRRRAPVDLFFRLSTDLPGWRRRGWCLHSSERLCGRQEFGSAAET